MTYIVCLSIFLQEILEEVRKELQKVKEEIIGGEVKKMVLKNEFALMLLCVLKACLFFSFTAFIQELQKRST